MKQASEIADIAGNVILVAMLSFFYLMLYLIANSYWPQPDMEWLKVAVMTGAICLLSYGIIISSQPYCFTSLFSVVILSIWFAPTRTWLLVPTCLVVLLSAISAERAAQTIEKYINIKRRCLHVRQ